MASASASADPPGGDNATAFFEETQRLRPRDLEGLRKRMDDFVAGARRLGRPVALVTLGGTTVPLEIKTVRFIDNFSTGGRGAMCTEEFLEAGYAVLLLHRRGASFPFLTPVVQALSSDPLSLVASGARAQAAAAGRAPPSAEALQESLLPVAFTTIFEYLFLLREACQSLAPAGREALVLLAAAVSDFYVPEGELAADKIQSHGSEGLTIRLRNVPKLLGATKRWAPEAFVVSFKLETNANILEAKAAGAIEKYAVDAVCSNMLDSYRDLVTLVWRDPGAECIEIGKEELQGDEAEPVAVRGLKRRRVERGSLATIDRPLVEAVGEMHREWRNRGAAS